MTDKSTKDAITSNDVAGAIPEDRVDGVNKNAAKAREFPFTTNFQVGDVITDGSARGVVKQRAWLGRVPMYVIYNGSAKLYIPDNLAKLVKKRSQVIAERTVKSINAKFGKGEVVYCRPFGCVARVLSVAETKNGMCNYKVALFDAQKQKTGEAVCSEGDLVRRAVRGLKSSGLSPELAYYITSNEVGGVLHPRELKQALRLAYSSPATPETRKVISLLSQFDRVVNKGKGSGSADEALQMSRLMKQVIDLAKQSPIRAMKSGTLQELQQDYQKLVAERNALYRARNQATMDGDKKKAQQLQQQMNANEKLLEPLQSALQKIGREREAERRAQLIGDAFAQLGRELANHRATMSMKLTGVARGASDACTTAANVIEKMAQYQSSKRPLPPNLPSPQKLVRMIQRDFPEARVQAALSYLGDKPPALTSAAHALRAESQRLKTQGKSVRAIRASVKRTSPTLLPLIAPLQHAVLMLYRNIISTPERANLGTVPALVGQWNTVSGKLPAEEQSGVRLIVRDLMSAYRSYAKLQIKNAVYFINMALATANKMVGAGDPGSPPRHLRSVRKPMKAVDAKVYLDKNGKLPIGSILKVNGKVYQVERANGFVISGFEYNKPWSADTRLVVDLRNSPATLLSVGNGTVRNGRGGSIIYGRRPAN